MRILILCFLSLKYIRVLLAPSTPVVATPRFTIPPLDVDELVSFNINGVFQDPARNKEGLIITLDESIIIALHDKAVPKNVENFLGYVTRSDYSNSFLHRSVSNFIIEWGGARPAFPGASPAPWANMPVQAAVPNEPCILNRRGTIAMAKFGGNFDSATSEAGPAICFRYTPATFGSTSFRFNALDCLPAARVHAP